MSASDATTAGFDPLKTIFIGPGSTPGMLRDIDWASTGLGPVETWPTRLVQVVRLTLQAQMPMMIWWGPDLIQIYNDAYARLAGNKHPAGIGQPASKCWSEVWNDLEPATRRVTELGESSFVERKLLLIDRHGYLEETYWTSSYSPIRDDQSDAVLGVLVTSTDVTAEVVGARRLETVRQLGTLSSSTNVGLEETCKAAIGVLAANRQAVPFATVHIIEPDGEHVRLAAAYGVGSGGPFNPAESFELDQVPELANAVRGRTRLLVTGLRERPDRDALVFSPLGEAVPDAAMLLPISVEGANVPVAVATLGVNPYRAVDDVYLAFFQLVARQLRVAVADALAYETQQHRAVALAELDEDKTRFYQNVSHELRTPVALVLGPLRSVLADPAALPFEHRQSLLSVHRAALRLRKLVDNMFQFSRVQTDELHAYLEPTDLAALTAELASMFRPIAEQAGLGFLIDVSEVTDSVDMDREMWAQIVLNLLSNAIKFTSEGYIAVQLRPSGDRIVLDVRDTGSGIAESQQERIFERFSQVEGKSGRSAEGAGIGLALVHSLAATLGGSVSVTSALGKGSTFRVEVPARAAADQVVRIAPERLEKWSPEAYLSEAQTWIDDQTASPTATPLQSGSIAGAPAPTPLGQLLLVEDNADMRGYLTRLLSDEGWTVHSAPSVETALLVPQVPDIIVSDVMLPGRSGIDLVRAIRADESLRRTPIVLLTARYGPDAAAEGLEAGADDYVVKPFEPVELLARIRVHYELAQLREFALSQAEDRASNLQRALASNRQIGVAMGVLMARDRLTEEQAFDLLRKASQNSNRKLRDVADDVVLTGQLP